MKNKVGRPTKYNKKYCQLIIEFMAKGYSKEAFAGEIGVHKETIYEWAKAHPEFSDSVRSGEAKSLAFWEKKGIEGVDKGPMFNDRAWKFNMQNRHGWREKSDIDHTTQGEKLPVAVVSYADIKVQTDHSS